MKVKSRVKAGYVGGSVGEMLEGCGHIDRAGEEEIIEQYPYEPAKLIKHIK